MKTVASLVLSLVVFTIQAQPAAAQAIRRPCKSEMRNQARVCIMAPRDGATVAGSSVRVVLTSKGISIAPVAEAKQGAAHFHLLLDVDVPPAGEAIPASTPGVTHLGAGQKEFVLEGVASGHHRLIVVLGDNAHVALASQKSDTIYFAVSPR